MLKYDEIDGNKSLVSASVLFVVTGTSSEKFLDFSLKYVMVVLIKIKFKLL